MAIVQSNLSANQSSPSPIELADRAQRRLFAASVVFGVVAALIGALLAWLLWRANNTYQDAVKKDADARIATADARATEANAEAAKANAGLKSAEARIEEARAETAKAAEEVARLTKEAEALRADAEKARADIATAQADAAKANEGAAQATAEVARLQIVVARAEKERAEAQRALLELQERLRPRVITAEQREMFVNLLKDKPKGSVQITCPINDGEACNLAADFRILLTEIGWKVDAGLQRSFFPGKAPTGIEISVRDPNKVPPAVEALAEALAAIGFPAHGSHDTQLPTDVDLRLIVEVKP